MATRKKKNNIGAFGHPIYGKGFAKYSEMRTNGSSEIPNDLEEAAAQYARDYTENDEGNGGDDWEDDIRITFIAGAKWQAEQYHFFNKAWAENMQAELDRNYENGKQAMKEQMLKEAVEGKVYDFRRIKEIGYSSAKIEFDKIPELDDGDKVRIIVCKNEDEK